MDRATKNFIEKAQKIHGDIYDYSKTIYKNSREPVIIICPEHGEFSKRPVKHLSEKQECPRCSQIIKNNKQKMSQEQFIQRCKDVHGDKYDYSKTEFISTNDKITIICPEHGEFQQLTQNHLNGQNCMECHRINNKQKLTQEQFIQRCKEIHGNKYDYSKTEFISTHDKLTIICPEHGEFQQLAMSHLTGKGCSECGKISSIESRRKNTESFIEQAKKIHGDKYNYSKTEYKSAKEPVIIICSEHGEFQQLPQNHQRGIDCPKCAIKRIVSERLLTTDIFIEYAQKIHGDRYNYSKSEYKAHREKLIIICPEHGEFEQKANNHLNGQGCPQCNYDSYASKAEIEIQNFIKESIMGWKTNNFIEKSKKVHGDKYDYSKTVYEHSRKKLIIICQDHGEFEQVPNAHLSGQNCPKCSSKKLTKEIYIERSNKVHDNKYDYSLLNYKNSNSNVKILCPEHGIFEQRADMHMRGYGCPKCANNQKMTKSEFIQKAQLIHGDKYNYDSVIFNSNKDTIIIDCKKHGYFSQRIDIHLFGQGCPQCSIEKQYSNTQDFIKTANQVHNNKYDYSKIVYKHSKEKVIIICPDHGEFEQVPNGHLTGNGCLKCVGNVSKAELELHSLFENFNFETNQRKILNGYELDIFIPEKNLAIEFNGLYWHNEVNRPDKNYHLKKTETCEKQGIHLIHIFEDEWIDKKPIVESRINNLLGINKTKIFGRKTIIKVPDKQEVRKFLETNHIQGFVGSRVEYGLFFDNELVSLMTFGSLRKNLGLSGNDNEYELLRFCNKLNTTVIGAASKLFKHFLKQHNPSRIVSYADRRWSVGKLYETLGFNLIHNSVPNYFYVIGQSRKNRFNFRKDILISKHGCSPEDTEHNFCFNKGWYRIYDCGTKVYEYINTTNTIKPKTNNYKVASPGVYSDNKNLESIIISTNIIA